MGINYRPLPTKCWEAFLTLHGFVCKRTKGSHDQWVKAKKRTIPVWGDEKEIPAFHLRRGCSSIGCSLDDLYAWAKANC
jgi:predicted RNA binding protein YcfA (HicA-like mRNA interferase family)